MSSLAILTAAIIPLVAGHGYVTSPAARVVGSAMEAACGQQIFNNQKADPAGNIQGEMQLIQSDFTSKCNLNLCKGYQFEDNSANIQSYTTGQVVAMTYDIKAPHTGTANVSIVDTATNTMIGSPLISWDVYASNAATIPADQLSFSITIPDLSGKCTTAGDCVIQHWWDAASINQTYESCIDFTVGSSSSSSGSTSSATAVAGSASITASTTFATSTRTSTSAATTTASPTTATGEDDSCETDAAATTASPTTATGEDDSCETDAATTTASPTTATGEDDSCETDTPETASNTTTPAAAATSAAASSGSSTETVALYGQCGGTGFTGGTTCVEGATCMKQNDYYSQCLTA